MGSPARLIQVVTNLVKNALDACKDKGGGTIEISLSQTENEAELRIHDDGSGISKENMRKIFDPMFTTKAFGEGTGLGLGIVKDIITSDFSGSIRVESEQNNYTCFTVLLAKPVKK